jgi:hypothetical protein
MTSQTPMGLFGQRPLQALPASQDDPDLAQRLRADSTGDLRRKIFKQLDDMQVNLRAQAERGADSLTFENINAGLAAVEAARTILTRMPVPSDSFHPTPVGKSPTDFSRSTP